MSFFYNRAVQKGEDQTEIGVASAPECASFYKKKTI